MNPEKTKPNTQWGCRLAWSRLVASGVIDVSSNLTSPTTDFGFMLLLDYIHYTNCYIWDG